MIASMRTQHYNGFTLIELMITVAIVGILAAVAYPSYQHTVQRSWRTNAASCLMELAQAMERRYTSSSSYLGSDDPPLLPPTSCITEGNMPNRYTFSFDTDEPTTTTFVILAQPVFGGPQAADECGTLAIDETGQKSADESIAKCWQR